MANYFLGSVGTAEAFRNIVHEDGTRETQLAFTSKTMTDTGVNISVTADEIRAGQGAPVVAKFFHDPQVEITLTDVMFKEAYVEAQLGAHFEVGGEAFQTENLLADDTGKITLGKNPLPLDGGCFTDTAATVWYKIAGTDAWKIAKGSELVGNVLTITTAGNKNICVRYLAADNEASSAVIYSDLVPEELHLIVTMPLFAGDSCSPSNGRAAGEVQFDIPRFRMNGAQDFAAAMSSNQTMSLAGTAMASEVSCLGSSKLMNINQKLYGFNIVGDVESIAFDQDLEAGDSIVVYGTRKDGSVQRISLKALTFTLGEDAYTGTTIPGTATSSNKLTAKLGTLTATYPAK